MQKLSLSVRFKLRLTISILITFLIYPLTLKAECSTAINGTITCTGYQQNASRGGEEAVISRKGYDYAPSVMFDAQKNIYRAWWCGYFSQEQSGNVFVSGGDSIDKRFEGDRIYYGESSSPYGPWQNIKIVFGPRKNTAGKAWDGGHTCDPSVIKANNRYYMYYGGIRSRGAKLDGIKQTTKIGLAVSSDGLNWNRINEARPIISPISVGAEEKYGAGHPTAIYIDNKFYLSFTDRSSTPTDSQHVIRASNPELTRSPEELTLDGWKNISSVTTRTLQGSPIVNAVNIDWAYIRATNEFVAIVNGLPGAIQAQFFKLDNTLRKTRTNVFLQHWFDGSGLVRNADGTLPMEGSSYKLDIMRANGCGDNLNTRIIGDEVRKQRALAAADIKLNQDHIQLAVFGVNLDPSSTVTKTTTYKIYGAKNDTNGDGRADFILFNSGKWKVKSSYSNSIDNSCYGSLGAAGDTPFVADIDGDGVKNIGVRSKNSNLLITALNVDDCSPFRMNANENGCETTLGASEDKIVIGDYDGDAKDDLAAWSSSQNEWRIRQSSDGSTKSTLWGGPQDYPLIVDLNRDGLPELLNWNPSTGLWWTWFSNNGGFHGVQHGLSGDTPVVGDFDGDGHGDRAVWRGVSGPFEGIWYIKYEKDYSVGQFQFGLAGDTPMPADYDGDKITDLAVWRPNEGAWYVKPSSGVCPPATRNIATYCTLKWGSFNDIAVGQ